MRIERRHHGAAEARLELEHAADIGDAVDHLAHVVGAPRIVRHDVAQRRAVGRLARRGGAAEIAEILARHGDGLGLVLDQHVDDARRHVHRGRADLLGRQLDAQRRLDQRRPGHAQGGILGGDQHVAHAGEVGVAGEGAAGQDADRRHQPRQAREHHEGRRGAAALDLHVVRPRAAAVEPAHHRQAMALGMLEHAGRLHVVDGALRAGIDRVVVDQQVDRPAVDLRRAHDHAVGGAGHARHRGAGEAAILDEAVGVDEGGDALAGRPAAALALLRHRLRAGVIENGGASLEHLLQVGPQGLV